MFNQQNLNTVFQQISIPNVIEKGPRLSQAQTFLDQKDLITEQSLDRLTVKCSQSQLNYDTPSPQQKSQQNTYKSQEGLARSNDDMLNIISSDPAASSNNFKQNLAIIKNPNLSNPQALYLGSDCFIENIQRSYPYSGPQSLESSSAAVVHLPNTNTATLTNMNQKYILPFNGTQQLHYGQQISNIRPNFQLNLNQVQMQQQLIGNQSNFKNFQQNDVNFNAPKENYSMVQQFGIPPVVNYNSQQLQQYQAIKQPMVGQNFYDISKQIQNQNSNQSSPIKFLVTPIQQQLNLQNQVFNQDIQNNNNNRQHSPNFLHKQLFNGYQGNFIQTNLVATPSKDGNSNIYENNSRNVSPDNQINNIHALNNKLQPNLSLISALNKDTQQNANINYIQNQNPNSNTQNINKFQVYNLQNVQKKLNQKTQNQQQQLAPYTITFGSSNNLNTVQSNNNNSSTMYQLLQPYQITNQSNNSQLNELSNASKGSSQIESQNYRTHETNKQHNNQIPSNVEFNCMLSAKSQLSQFPQLLTPYAQNQQQINNISMQQQGVTDVQNQSQNNQSKESYQQNIKNQLKPQNEQQYHFYPISMQRRGSQSQYVSPKESNSTALTSPIDIQVRQNKLGSCLQGESNHTTMRICEISSTMNPLQIPSENTSQRDENIILNQHAQNSSYQTQDKYIFQNNNKSDLNQKQSDQSSSVTMYQASSQTGQSSNQFAQSNNSLNSQKSGKGNQFSGLVQIKEELDSDNQMKQNIQNKKQQENNQLSNTNHQIYYYKTNKQDNNEETKKKSRKSNQSYDLAASYYNRIRQFNESSHEEKIELCLKGNHKQCLINPKRLSLNRTDKSLDGSNIHESHCNSSKCNSNSQLASSTQLNNSQNVKTQLSKSKERNSSQEKQNLAKKPPKIMQNDNQLQQEIDNSNSQKVNEEKLLSLLSPSYKKVQQIQQLMKIEQERLQKEKEKFTEIQENKGIFTFSNQRKQTHSKETKVSPNKQGKNSSPNSQLSSDVNSPIKKKHSSKKQELEQNFSETKSADQYHQQQNNLNQESENTEEKQKKTPFNQPFKQKPIVQAAFQVNPYFVADKYLSAQEIQAYQQDIQNIHSDLQNNEVQNYEQDEQNYQQGMQNSHIELQNYCQQNGDYQEHRQIYHQKDLLCYNQDRQDDDHKQNPNQQFYKEEQQNNDELNNSQNQQLQNFSLAPHHFNNFQQNENTSQQINDQNPTIEQQNHEQANSKQFFNQKQDGLATQQPNSNYNKNYYLNQQINQPKKGKLINTIFIDMSEVSENGSKIPVFKGCSLTTTNSSYQNKSNQFQLLNSKDDSDQFISTKKFQKEYQQKKEIFIDQNQDENNFQIQNSYQTPSNNQNNIYQNTKNINFNQNQYYQSPDKSDTNLNQIVIFDTQFQTQEDLKSAQNLNQKNWSTLQGMNMVTVESQNGGYDNIQKFQFSPQTLQTEQGIYENVYNNNSNKKVHEKKEENTNNGFDNVVSLEKSNSKSNQRYSCNQNLDEESPDNSYYYLQDSPQIKNKQIRPTIVPQLNLQKSFQNTLTTLNQNTSFNISQSPSSHKNIQQNFKSQLSNLNQNYKEKQQIPNQVNNNNYQNQENDENINYIQQPDYQQTCSNKQSFKRHASLSSFNQFQNNNNIQSFQISKQSTPVNNKIYLPTQPNSLTNSSFLNATANQKKQNKNQTSNSNVKTIQRNKSLGSIVGNVGYQSEEMGHEMFLTKKLKNQLNSHLQFLENRIKLLQREEEQIRKKASSSKKQAENAKKIYQQVQEEHQNHHTIIEAQQKNWIEAKKNYIQNVKKEHNSKIKKVMSQQQREKQEMARSIKFNSHINKSVAEDLKQSHLIKTSEKKNQIKQSQLKCQEQRHLQQLYNQTSQMQQFLLKIKDEKVKKEELEQKIQALEQLEMQLVEKLQQTYESNKHYLKNSNIQSQLSVHQSNFIDHQQQAKRESLQSNTEVVNTNTSFTVFNQY
ncbi:hypothetical protein TTHERM_00560060 (macronuclear) [Tetrahymena thermophila SB210]|uniref:Uncharacterized protein n=1 Tax=Tetrahymena thermophila (strain SB210) TaxID=312017 RepID=I7MHV1_TETTS|nr:hypothetical protein TTHERM_00560060 [Tetrahymena thermophila SB210]EAR89915.1 hypothetical protein TTHERM_00560060 [Tetrahymena thermophila SB210]|eukprot:XP_001010160.1 hypothetical protein TTHERM_00560060 [Tetrahymena thermophila SB210]